MKRCPQCEFIYEDDQSLCDMDGVLLVFDARALPNLHALATLPDVPAGKAARRNRMVPAFATILLTLVIASLYYFSTPRNVVPVENFVPSVTIPTPETIQAQPPVVEPAVPVESPKTEEAKPTSPAKPPAAPARKATTKPAAVVKPEEPKKKDDSKVGSILKKTGKILKKPFKF